MSTYRYGVFVHSPNGDMGDGLIIGAFKSPGAAERKAESIRRADSLVECIVLSLVSGDFSAHKAARWVQES